MKTVKTENPLEAIRSVLAFDYGISGRLANRYAKLLVKRAVAFYIDAHLDAVTVEEDLYQEDGKYVNLEYMESHCPLEAVYEDDDAKVRAA